MRVTIHIPPPSPLECAPGRAPHEVFLRQARFTGPILKITTGFLAAVALGAALILWLLR